MLSDKYSWGRVLRSIMEMQMSFKVSMEKIQNQKKNEDLIVIQATKPPCPQEGKISTAYLNFNIPIGLRSHTKNLINEN